MEEIIEQVQEQNVDGDFGSNKFKDVDALKKAYERLQAEFTKRCQRVKELEGMMAKIDKVEKPADDGKKGEDANQSNLKETEDIGGNGNGESSTPKPANIGEILNSIPSGTTDKLKEQVLKDYLKSVIEGKPQAIIMDGLGTGLKTLSKRPTTFQEAGDFAIELLKN